MIYCFPFLAGLVLQALLSLRGLNILDSNFHIVICMRLEQSSLLLQQISPSWTSWSRTPPSYSPPPPTSPTPAKANHMQNIVTILTEELKSYKEETVADIAQPFISVF